MVSFFRGEVVNGGFGLVLDGTEAAAQKAALMLSWDVSNGVARRSVHPETTVRISYRNVATLATSRQASRALLTDLNILKDRPRELGIEIIKKNSEFL